MNGRDCCRVLQVFPSNMFLLSPSSAFYPFLWMSPTNPLDSEELSYMLRQLEDHLGMSLGHILDVLPAAVGLLSLSGRVEDAEISHIESCLLRPFYDKHRLAMWYVLLQLRKEDEEEDVEEE